MSASGTITVTLSYGEQVAAATIGVQRQLEAIRAGRPDTHGFEGLGWDLHVEGAAGELALAKACGVYWPASVNTFRDGEDVTGYEVRTRSKPYYDLILRPNDDPEKRYVLITGKMPVYQIRGWILGKDGMQEQFWRTIANSREPAYFIPALSLTPVTPRR